jgi:hypothetical protein
MQHAHNYLFKSENQTKTFSYTIFHVKKINVAKKFKIMRKLLFNCSLYSHVEAPSASAHRSLSPASAAVKSSLADVASSST